MEKRTFVDILFDLGFFSPKLQFFHLILNGKGSNVLLLKFVPYILYIFDSMVYVHEKEGRRTQILLSSDLKK